MDKKEKKLLKKNSYFKYILEIKCQSNLKKLIYDMCFYMNSPKININFLKDCISTGILQINPNLRSLCWKLLLYYLPKNIYDWEEYLNNKRLEYKALKKYYSIDINSKEYSKMIDLINKDMVLIRSKSKFFREKSLIKKQENNYNIYNFKSHLDILEEILYIFGRKYPKIGYMTEFSEILSIIYYTFSLDSNPFFNEYVEEDSFFCFEILINYFQKLFNKEYNEDVDDRINHIKFILKTINPEVYDKLIDKKIEIYMFILKWYRSFFSQEFSIKKVMNLWDNLFCQKDKYDFLDKYVLAVFFEKKDILLIDDYNQIIENLQYFEDEESEKILKYLNDVENNINLKTLQLQDNEYKKFLKDDSSDEEEEEEKKEDNLIINKDNNIDYEDENNINNKINNKFNNNNINNINNNINLFMNDNKKTDEKIINLENNNNIINKIINNDEEDDIIINDSFNN